MHSSINNGGSVTDGQMKDRVKLLLRGPSNEADVPVPASAGSASAGSTTLPMPLLPPSDPALQVLTLAQRTAEEHISAANRHANKTRMDAQAAADQIGRDAQLHANSIRVEADTVLAEARTAAELTAHEATIRAQEIRREAEAVLTAAREQAGLIVGNGREHAEQLKIRAQQKYEDAVGGLGLRRTALQGQIEALEMFDSDYRKRLTAFMQAQLRALWAERPQVNAGPDAPAAVPGGPMATNGAS
jgi:hypothetical protein